jgi:hypothetical protein
MLCYGWSLYLSPQLPHAFFHIPSRFAIRILCHMEHVFKINDIHLLEKPTVKENRNMDSWTKQGQNDYCQLVMVYFCVLLCSLIFTNCIFRLHNIFYLVFLLHVSNLCGHHQVLLIRTLILPHVSHKQQGRTQWNCTRWDRNAITRQKDNYIHKTTNKKEDWRVEKTNTPDSTMRNNKNRLEGWQHKTKENKRTYS